MATAAVVDFCWSGALIRREGGTMQKLLLMLVVLVVSSCKSPTLPGSGIGPDQPVGTPLTPLAWESGRPEAAAWSAELRRLFVANLAPFEAATDIGAFCPNWTGLATTAKVEALATMAVAMARRESSYNPATVFGEPPPLSVDSVGLFQLSYEDGFGWCDLDRARDTLKDPLENIRCAVPAMARLVARDGILAGGGTTADARGMARYWSVVRTGPSHFLDEIKASSANLSFCAL